MSRNQYTWEMIAEDEQRMPENIHEHLELSLYIVEKASYRSLRIIDRQYPHWTVSYVLCGDVEVVSQGIVWHAKTGDVMLHPPHLPFSEMATRAGTHQWLLIDMTISHNIDLFRLYPVFPVVTLQEADHFSHVFDILLQVWHDSTSPFRNMQASALALQLCGMVLESWQQAGCIPRPPELMTPQDRFIDVIKYMAEHLDQKISRDDLAAIVHLHPGYFDRVFSSIYSKSPMQMLRDLRLRRALQLLETTDAPLSSIALACGLSDAGYFSRVFRQHYGQSPGQYRESVKSTMKGYILPL